MVSCAKTLWFMSVLFSFRECAVILLRHAHVITPLTKYFAWRHTVLLHQHWQTGCDIQLHFFLLGFLGCILAYLVTLFSDYNEMKFTRMLNYIIMWEHFCVHTYLGAVIVWLTILFYPLYMNCIFPITRWGASVLSSIIKIGNIFTVIEVFCFLPQCFTVSLFCFLVFFTERLK